MAMRDPILKQVEQFTITGFYTRTKNNAEANLKTAKIPSLWQQFYSSGLSQHIPAYGVYSDYESDSSGFYTLTVGVRQENNETGINKVTIETGNYLVFSSSGPMPDTVINLWKQIWNYFDDQISYRRHFMSDFEIYHSADRVDIYIGIK